MPKYPDFETSFGAVVDFLAADAAGELLTIHNREVGGTNRRGEPEPMPDPNPETVGGRIAEVSQANEMDTPEGDTVTAGYNIFVPKGTDVRDGQEPGTWPSIIETADGTRYTVVLVKDERNGILRCRSTVRRD